MDAVFRDALRQIDSVSEVLDSDTSQHYACGIWIGIGLINDAFMTVKVDFSFVLHPSKSSACLSDAGS